MIAVRRVDLAIALALFGFHLFLYWSTLTPGLGYDVDPLNPPGDTHEFTMAIAELRLTRRTGYPLYTWLGHLFTLLFPFGELAYRTNFLSAVYAGSAVIVIFAIARRVGLRPATAAFAAMVFGIGTTFWSQAVITEVYTLNTLALSLVIWFLLGWAQTRSTAAFAKFALAYGVSLGCHTSNLAFGAVFTLFILATDTAILKRPMTLAAGFLVFLIGVSQYVWLPLMAHTAPFPNQPPDSLEAFYNYTLGAFSNLRFAFPWYKLPARFLFYLARLNENFTLIGMAIGAIGIKALWRAHRQRFLLFFGLFTVNVTIAMQVYATDTQVFFLPSYIAWAIFLGFGIEAIWASAMSRIDTGRQAARRAVQVALVVLLGTWAVFVCRASFAENDRTGDTSFEDFYATVFAYLPHRAYLAPGAGVFGQGANYFQRVLGWRPDVTIHSLPKRLHMPPEPVYSTLRLKDGRAKEAFTRSPFPPNAWMAPELVADQTKGLVLYRVDRTPPRLVVRRPPPPGGLPGKQPVELASRDVRVIEKPPRTRLRIDLKWTFVGAARYTVLVRIDGVIADTHLMGFGNLARYEREFGPLREQDLVLENYDLVLPRSISPGTHVIEIGLLTIEGKQVAESWFGKEEFVIREVVIKEVAATAAAPTAGPVPTTRVR